MGSSASREAVKAIRDWAVNEGRALQRPTVSPQTFGSLVFNDEVQRASLPKPVYRALRRTITQGEPLTRPSPTRSPRR
mgnify:CR=1 FL=1